MTRFPRLAATTAVALAVVSMSGCGALTSPDVPQPPRVSVPAVVPVTFARDARWVVDLAPGTVPAPLEEGIAVLMPGRASPSLYRVALLSPTDGSIRWASEDFVNPTPNMAPVVAATVADGQSWVIVRTYSAASELRLHMYSPQGTGDRRTPDVAATIPASAPGTVPQAQIGAAGVAVTANQMDYQRFAPATGKLTAYPGPGKLDSVWGEGMVVTNPTAQSGFGFIATNRGTVSWQSATSRPAGTKPVDADKGTLLTSGDGLVLSRWLNPRGAFLLAVQEARSGNVLAVLDNVDATTAQAAQSKPVLRSGDGRWAAVGPLVFGLKGGRSARVDLHGGQVSTIYRDVLYVKGARTPLTADTAAGSSPAATPSGSSPQPSGTTFAGMVDAGTGEPLTNARPQVAPLFVSTQSQGLFVISDQGHTRLFSTPLS